MQTIHILRHFKVKDTIKEKLDSKEFSQWVELYDNTPLEYVDIKLPDVDKVYVSTQSRAIKTAQYLKINYEKSELLKEVEVSPFMDTKYKFSKNFWLVVDRALWLFNLNKKENKADTIKRVDQFFEKIKDEEDVLIVSHGLFIKVFISQLKKKGFIGKVDFRAKNAKLYSFRKHDG